MGAHRSAAPSPEGPGTQHHLQVMTYKVGRADVGKTNPSKLCKQWMGRFLAVSASKNNPMKHSFQGTQDVNQRKRAESLCFPQAAEGPYWERSMSFSFPTSFLCFSWNSLAASSCGQNWAGDQSDRGEGEEHRHDHQQTSPSPRSPPPTPTEEALIKVLMRWMKLEPIIQSEVSQKDKDHYNILTHIYGI